MKKIMLITEEPFYVETSKRKNPEFMEVDDNWIPEPEENTVFTHTYLTDYNYFSMVDNQVRSEFTLCEEFAILPKIENLYTDNNISMEKKDLVEYPTEGYYYKTDGLRKYFQLVRNLQENPSVYKKIDKDKYAVEIKELSWLFGNTIWGTIPSLRSETIFPRMKDILTNTLNSLQLPQLWTIDKIMEHMNYFATGNPNLVELAYLTKDVRCLCAGAETNALYREMSFCASGCFMITNPTKKIHIFWWNVSENVQNLGEKLVDKYNEVMNHYMNQFSNSSDFTISHTNSNLREFTTIYGSFGKVRTIPKLIQKPELANFKNFKCDLESPRVAMLGQLLDSPAHYHWILDNNEVKEVWMDGVMTTERYKEGKGEMQFRGWDMSGVVGEDGKINLGKLWSTDSKKTGLPEIVPGEVKTDDTAILWNNSTYNMNKYD